MRTQTADTDDKKSKDDLPPEQPHQESRDAKTRANLMGHINAAIARMEQADKRANNAKSNLGTAQREQRDSCNNYNNLLEQLHKHLPLREHDPAPED